MSGLMLPGSISLLRDIVETFHDMFTSRETYHKKILKSLPPISADRLSISCSDLLTLHRLESPGSWDVETPGRHKMELQTASGVSVMIWGCRLSDHQLVSYIACAGCRLEFQQDFDKCIFRLAGKEVAIGTNIFAERFELTLGDKKLAIIPPKSRWEWNSAYQKPSLIKIHESDQEIGRLILQPSTDAVRVVESFPTDAYGLSAPQLLALLSLTVILNSRFA